MVQDIHVKFGLQPFRSGHQSCLYFSILGTSVVMLSNGSVTRASLRCLFPGLHIFPEFTYECHFHSLFSF